MFSVTFRGNIEEGNIQWGTVAHTEDTPFIVKKTIPGPSCATACENRVVLSFNSLDAGEILDDEFQAQSVTISALDHSGNQSIPAMVFDSANPSGNDLDLGTKNVFYGGPGEPSLDFSTGAGIGNYLELNKVAILSCDGDSSDPDVHPDGGTFVFDYDRDVQIIGSTLLDVDKYERGGSFSASDASSNPIFTDVSIDPLGSNSRQRVNVAALNGYETRQLKIKLDGSAAIDNLTYCIAPICGDGNLDSGEQCDDGNDNDADGCRNDCTLPSCGDGILDDGEQCDDGNDINTDTCRNDCTAPICGDGILDDGEQGDDGNSLDGDGCSSSCLPDCEDLDISNLQFTMDGASDKLALLVRKHARKLRRLQPNTKTKRFVRNTRETSQALHLVAWRQAWSLESVQVSCEFTPITCVTVSNAETLLGYQEVVQELFELLVKVDKRVRRARGEVLKGDRRIRKRARKELETAFAASNEVPLNSVRCGGLEPDEA